LFKAGDHVPVIGVALVDDVGNGDKVAPEQIGATALNVGVITGCIVTDVVAVTPAQPPAGATV
jgi:hypothetical protein